MRCKFCSSPAKEGRKDSFYCDSCRSVCDLYTNWVWKKLPKGMDVLEYVRNLPKYRNLFNNNGEL